MTVSPVTVSYLGDGLALFHEVTERGSASTYVEMLPFPGGDLISAETPPLF